MSYLLPHAVIVVAAWAWAHGALSERTFLICFAGAHLAAPVWAAYIAPRTSRTRAFLVGPGSVIAIHAIAIVVTWLVLLGGIPEDTWIAMMLVMWWAGALLAYVVYCAISFGVVARLRR